MEGIATFDIESNHWIDLEMLGMFDGKQYKLFRTAKQFLSYIDKKEYNKFRFYAHNAGRFDILFLLEELLENWDVVKMIERSGSLIFLKAHGKNATITFADSYALLPKSLRDLAKTFDVEHKKMESPDFEKGVHFSSARDKKYLEFDCLALYEVLEKALDFFGELKFTIASQAMETFVTQYGFETEQFSTAFEDELRGWYYGGRTEVYKARGEGLKYYDVNSLYPHAMLQGVPVGLPNAVSKRSRKGIGFYTIQVKKDIERYLSPLPFRFNKSLYFTQGEGFYQVGSPTLDILDEEGVQYKVHSGLEFESIAYIFKDYVEYFYDLKRKNKGNAIELISKLLLNSLYGKFGSKRLRNEIVPWSANLENEKYFMEGYVLIEKRSKSKFIYPAIAAWITETARVLHYRLMQQHPQSMFYADTDSLLTSASYPVGTAIGELKQEGTYDGIFLAPKFYALRDSKQPTPKHDKVIFKGYGSGDLHFKDYEKVLAGKKVIEQTRIKMLSFRECLRRKAGILQSRGKFLKTVNFSRTARLESTKRLTLTSNRYTFDTVPYTQDQIILTTKGE